MGRKIRQKSRNLASLSLASLLQFFFLSASSFIEERRGERKREREREREKKEEKEREENWFQVSFVLMNE